MFRFISLIFFLLFSSLCYAESKESTELPKSVKWKYKVDSIANSYSKELDALVAQRSNTLGGLSYERPLNAYGLRMVLPPTFDSSSVLQQFSVNERRMYPDDNLMYMYMINDALAKVYVDNPEIIVQIDEHIEKAGTLRKDVETSLNTETKLADKVVGVDLESDMEEDVELVTRKPNFWKFSGSGSLQFSQNYFSDNWCQGGENYYSFLSLLTLNANYDNKKNVQWENKLEARLGFQTTGKSETHHALKPTDNLLRLTTKLGYKAYKTLYYTTQVQAYTQIVPLYESNSDEVRTNFLSPLNLTVSVGLDYKFATNNKKFSGNVYMAPCSYNMRYVSNVDLATKHGIEEGHHAYHNFGPSITVNANWQILKNLSWNARMYWISNFSYTNIEMENTFNLTINKFLSARLFVYPKFDDSSEKYRGRGGSYFMMKEMLSVGFNYNW